jgi:hypothetical protein
MRRDETTAQARELNRYLWVLAAAPAIWAAHLILSYATAAIWCAKLVTADGSLSGARTAIAIYSGLALLGIGFIGWRGWKRHRLGGARPPHDADSAADRHRFLGFATVLLSGLSAVAVVYATLTIVFVRDCR